MSEIPLYRAENCALAHPPATPVDRPASCKNGTARVLWGVAYGHCALVTFIRCPNNREIHGDGAEERELFLGNLLVRIHIIIVIMR